MSDEEIIAILKMSEQEKWQKGITQEQEKEAIDRVTKALANQVPEGVWEVEENDEYFCRCSNCKKNTVPRYTHKPAYCDKCGAKMTNC